MKIFVTGCLHGLWEEIYNEVNNLINKGENIDLILIGGDSQALRDEDDHASLAIPDKYRELGSFHKFYNGELKMPRLTLVIGGNHECADLYGALPYGGWIAPNIYYLGISGTVKVGSIQITGFSGIYSTESYRKPLYESYPFRGKSDTHTINHIRNFTLYQVLALKHTDIIITHDWPRCIITDFFPQSLSMYKHMLLKKARNDIFGFPEGLPIISNLKPRYWFAAHYHTFCECQANETSFVALAKKYKGQWYGVYEIEGETGPLKISGEWISILKSTEVFIQNQLMPPDKVNQLLTEIKANLEVIEDKDPLPYNKDPIETTIEFCRTYGITCTPRFLKGRI